MAQGPINAVLYQPTRPGIGVGEAQVLQSPRTDRAIEFMRRENAQIRAEERAQSRKERDELFDSIDISIAASKGLEVWSKDADRYAQLQGELIDLTIEEIDNLQKGGEKAIASRLKILRKSAEVESFAKTSLQQMKRAEVFAEAARDNPSQFYSETYQEMHEIINTPGADIPSYMLIPDQTLDLSAEIEDMINAVPDKQQAGLFVEQGTVTKAGGVQSVRWGADVDKYRNLIGEYVWGDPERTAAAASRHRQKIKSGELTYKQAVELTIDQEVAMRESLGMGDVRSIPGSGGSGSGKITPQQVQKAANAKQAARNFAQAGDRKMLNEFIEGFNWVVKEDDDGDLEFSQVTRTEDGQTNRNVHVVKRSNEQAILNKIAEINPNITMEMIEAAPEPEVPIRKFIISQDPVQDLQGAPPPSQGRRNQPAVITNPGELPD